MKRVLFLIAAALLLGASAVVVGSPVTVGNNPGVVSYLQYDMIENDYIVVSVRNLSSGARQVNFLVVNGEKLLASAGTYHRERVLTEGIMPEKLATIGGLSAGLQPRAQVYYPLRSLKNKKEVGWLMVTEPLKSKGSKEKETLVSFEKVSGGKSTTLVAVDKMSKAKKKK